MRNLALTVCLLSSLALGGGPNYQTGMLLDITHQDSSRVVGNSQTGAITSVNDREYQIAVKVGSMTYVGSYCPRWRWSYEPIDFVVNTEIKVRITKKDMYILRADNKELRTTIIKRISGPPASVASQP